MKRHGVNVAIWVGCPLAFLNRLRSLVANTFAKLNRLRLPVANLFEQVDDLQPEKATCLQITMMHGG